ncbi:MAG: hypothetical protein QRY72_04925 [Candidatus Rhabdochlamydia sp.]
MTNLINELYLPRCIQGTDFTFYLNKSTRDENILTLFRDNFLPQMFVQHKAEWKAIKSYDMPKEMTTPHIAKKILFNSALSTQYCDNGECRIILNMRIMGGSNKISTIIEDDKNKTLLLKNFRSHMLEMKNYTPQKNYLDIGISTLGGCMVGAVGGTLSASVGASLFAGIVLTAPVLVPVAIVCGFIGGVLGFFFGYKSAKKRQEEERQEQQKELEKFKINLDNIVTSIGLLSNLEEEKTKIEETSQGNTPLSRKEKETLLRKKNEALIDGVKKLQTILNNSLITKNCNSLQIEFNNEKINQYAGYIADSSKSTEFIFELKVSILLAFTLIRCREINTNNITSELNNLLDENKNKKTEIYNYARYQLSKTYISLYGVDECRYQLKDDILKLINEIPKDSIYYSVAQEVKECFSEEIEN